MSIEEVWKDIEKYEGLYMVSNFGKIKSMRKNIDMKFNIRSGYYIVVLRKDGTRKSVQVHRAVAKAFIPNLNNKPVVNHKDFIRTNNKADNLEWVTQKENIQWSICNMKKSRTITHSNTNQRYIHYRKKYKTFEVVVKKVYVGQFKNIDEAIVAREKEILAHEQCHTK